MSKSASEWSVASKANQFMDSVFLERKPPGKPYLRKNVSTLKALRDEMFALGFDAPFKGLQEFYYALRSLKLQYPQSYHEKTREVVRGLKELKQEAYIKRVTLDRVRVALKANQMALQRLDSRVFDSGLASHAPLGGEWAVKLEKMNVHARAAFFQLFEELAGGSDSREVSIDVKFERNGAELRAVEVVPVDSKAVEYLNDKYGKGKFQVLNVRFSTQRLGLVKDKYSRFCLAISVIERIEKAAREKSVSELSGQVDLERLEVYEKILRRHNLSPEARTLDLDALDGLKGELSRNGFMDDSLESLKHEVADAVFLKKSVFQKNYLVFARVLLALELLHYYLLNPVSYRNGSHALPGVLLKPGPEDLELLKALEDPDSKAFLSFFGFPVIKSAGKMVQEKLLLESKSDVPDPFLGALLFYKNSSLKLGEVCSLLKLPASEFKLYCSKTKTVKLDAGKLRQARVAETPAAEKFVKALKLAGRK